MFIIGEGNFQIIPFYLVYVVLITGLNRKIVFDKLKKQSPAYYKNYKGVIVLKN